MSDTYYLACSKCKEHVWIGQSSHSQDWCFYTGEPKTMEELKEFFWKHTGHLMVFDEMQNLDYQGYLADEVEE